MNQEHFFEIVLVSADFNFGGRDEVEDPLDEALQELGVGEVSGGGSGGGYSNVDVDATDYDVALNIIRRVLGELGVASNTIINYYSQVSGERRTLPLYE